MKKFKLKSLMCAVLALAVLCSLPVFSGVFADMSKEELREMARTVAEPGKPLDSYSNSYDDVRPGSWYYDAVMVLTEGGLFGGYGNGKFGPNDTITFGQFKIVMSRLTGGKAYGPVSGIDLSTSVNRTPMTRGATAMYLYNTCKSYYVGSFPKASDITSVDDFPDSEAIIDWFYLFDTELYSSYGAGRIMGADRTSSRNAANAYVVPAVQRGWFRGVDSQGTFNAAGTLTRAQFCQVLYNAGWLTADFPRFAKG